MLYFLLALALAVGITVFLVKKGKIKDSDGDLIPDAVEEKLEEAAKVAKEIKENVEDVVEDVKEIVEEIKEKPAPKKRGRKPSGKGGRVKKTPATSGEGSATLKRGNKK
jgi:peptidoglycan hydrolase CwlO-like protein